MDEPRIIAVDGKRHKFPPGTTDVEISAALNAVPASNAAAVPKARTWTDTAKDVAIGVAKGAAHTALDAGKVVQLIPGVKKAVDTLYGTPGISDASFKQAREGTAYANTPQMVGGALETAAELAVPVSAAADALPSAARAGRKFQSVMKAAGKEEVRVSETANAALRIQQLAERGGSMPKVVRNFLGRVTDPSKGALTYEEARDFASNISRLSADEFGRLTPVVHREVGTMRMELNKAIGQAAAKAGKMKEYESAMREYAKAAKLRNAIDAFKAGAKRALPYAIGGGAAGLGFEAVKKLQELIPE